MRECDLCRISVADSELVCPLCGNHLEHTLGPGENRLDRYPEYQLKTSVYRFMGRLYLVISLLICLAAVALDILLYDEAFLSLLTIGAVGYSWSLLFHAIRSNRRIASKLIVQVISGSCLIVLVDMATVFQGWSVNYVVPSLAILGNVGIVILMLVNRLNWREFLMYQLGLGILSVLPLLLVFWGLVTRPLLSILAVVVAWGLIIGTWYFGDKTVKSELIRRFHV